MAKQYPESFTLEMGLTREEFFRSLPAAVAPGKFLIEGETVNVQHMNGDASIALTQKKPRKIGMLSLPVMMVAFSFPEWSDVDRNQFMCRFERYYQRGGG
ncbi:MAG: hypothetical protein GY779_06660 [Gammaproteobacteria bacterium]|nr:hypothetical protein [Gammaproteobacteria bacterium]MCP4993467.1 hypothetical protein [Gammaproteobacteria bacterium]